ncbi:proton channel OtopLc-like [Dendronephthya gigantea]|uniref:proton channel OtopLc-like n=1 Tax=Dendronephthya gigantea TaxID=151771 RepID=UPI00106B28FC|nr:proton channel OtopLc-like [Dendronephthya gigantea]
MSSSLLGSDSSGLSYTNERPVTPSENIICEKWYYTLLSSFHYKWQHIKDLYAGSWREFLGKKLEAILRCFCLPCSGLTHALHGRRQYNKYQTGIMYLYFYLCSSVVLNLVVALKNVHLPMAENIQKIFVILSMIVAIVLMSYLYEAGTNSSSVQTRGTLLRLFYEGGLSVFGISTFGYSLCIAIDNLSCGKMLDSVVAAMKAMFTLSQIPFLHHFYEARIPENTPFIQITLAHLLGTNLALWFWALCSEQAEEMLKECKNYPIKLGNSEHYFSPFFVEYLLLAASLFYQIWSNLYTREAGAWLQRHCRSCHCQIPDALPSEDVENTNDFNDVTIEESRWRSGKGCFLGSCFAVFFIILVLMATDANHQSYHIVYSFGIFVLYLTQILACLISKLSLQSHQRESERSSVDHEDLLLYFSLTGILLWHAFHVYSLLLNSDDSRFIDIPKDLLGMLQHLIQTATLIDLRRYKAQPVQNAGHSSAWICHCVLFLMTTNLILWAESSFFLKVDITTPGETYIKMQHELKTIGYIIYPLSIFFRFHSSVCCLIAWDIFRVK